MSNIVLNIVEPASPTPINPTDPVVPDTGLFTSGIGGAEAAIIATISLAIILAIVGAFVYYKKKAKMHDNKSSLFTHFKHSFKHNKSTNISLTILAIAVSLGTLAGLVNLTTSAIEGNDIEAQSTESSSALTVDVSSTEFTIELADDPVFAVLPVDITVEEATTLGYTLTAFAEDTNLVSTTDSSNIIPMVAYEDTPVALTANTYGLSFTDPDSITDEIYTSLSTDSAAPTFITDKDYLATAANDTTTIYYGFYITPDTPYGTYTGSNITVDAIPNMATVTYNANGLYFNDSEEATTNTVGYKPNIAEAPIEEVVGEYITPAPLTPVDPSTTIHYTFLGWSETEGATTPTYTNEEDILANLTLTKNESLTLYAVWHYDTVLSFDGNTSDGGTSLADITIPAGETITLPQNTYTRTGSVFTGWNTAADGSGEAYADEASFTTPLSSADITLYAQWAYTTTITFSGNGADSGSMSPQTVVAGTPQTLTKNTFTKTNATFIGWNTVQYPTSENPGTAYEDQAEYIASTTEHQDITLYAQWAYTTISFNGNTSDSGTMNSIIIAGGTTSNLPANTFIKNNCIFTGWNTDTSGTGISYGNSTPYTANATTTEAFTLYAQWQCVSQVNYYGNGATSGEMSSSIILGGSTLTFSQNTYAKDGYVFNGWNTKADGTGTPYPDQGTYTAPMTPAATLNLYAQWEVPPPPTDLTFTAGDHIDTLMVADGSNKYKPFYVTPTSTDKSIVFTAPAEGTKYIITVVPEAGYVLSSDSTSSSYEVAFSTGTLASNTLLTTNYTAGSAGNIITVSAAQAGSDTAHPAYTTMQSLTAAQCPGQGINVTDSRNNKSYAVAKFGNYCYMLSNLRLDGGTELDASSSHVSSTYTLPADTGSGGWTNDACQPRMASTNGEYYYNWPAATARTNSTSGTYSCYNDTSNSKGDICPAGWSLPTYQDIAPETLWNNGTNPGMLSTTGNVGSDSQYGDGDNGLWWSSTRLIDNNAYNLYFTGTNANRSIRDKYNGLSVRCMRSS